MTDVSPASDAVRRRMQRQARRDTKPELEIRTRLFALGFRYRVQMPVPELRRRSIDVAFTRVRLAVFVDGCFWHGCPVHAVPPKNNAAWWNSKIAANRARDAETTSALVSAGWSVMRIWEHESSDDAVERIARALAKLDSQN